MTLALGYESDNSLFSCSRDESFDFEELWVEENFSSDYEDQDDITQDSIDLRSVLKKSKIDEFKEKTRYKEKRVLD